jgi:tetratricopeptide (TPR) repeat protein
MSEHELWNELGNLYFMTGAFKQASYAYNRSIQLETRYGRPYSNLAYSCVQQGKFAEAVDLYRSSIELLTDDREKAITWFRLGDVYRRLKDYRDAILAYQQADMLDPSISQDETDVGKVLYGASNLEPTNAPAPVEAAKIEPAKSEAALQEVMTPQATVTETVLVEPATNEVVIPVTIAIEMSRTETTPEPAVEAVQSESAETIPATGLAEESSEAMENPESEFVMDEVESLPEPMDENTPEVEETRPDDWMLFTDPELPDETLTEWIATIQPEQEAEVTFHAAEESYAETGYTAPAPSLPAEPAAYPERKDLMVIEKQAVTSFVVAPEEEVLEENAPAPAEAVDKAVHETVQAAPITDEEEQSRIEFQIETLRRLLQEEPTNAPAWDELGELYKTVRLYKEAIPAYLHAAENDPKNVQYLYHLGCTYAIEGLADDAVKTFQRIIKLDSSHALAHATLGGYYRKMGLEELAQKHIGKAVKNFYDSENEYNRACLQALCGNVEDAINLLRTALQTEQTYVDWVLRDPDLDSIRTDSRFKQMISEFS